MKDLIIIGGGPSGISCALEALENQLDTIVLERSSRVGGQLASIPSPIQNLSTGVYRDGSHLRDELEAVALQFIANHVVKGAEVVEVDLIEKTVRTSSSSYQSKTLVLATGYRVKRFEVEFENTFEEDVFYTTGGRKEEFSGKAVAIIGGGDSALMTALDLADICKQVHVIVRSSRLKARPDVISLVLANDAIVLHRDCRILSLFGQSGLQGLSCLSSSGEFKLSVAKIIVKIGYLPNTELFQGQLLMDGADHILVDQALKTSVDGVYAVGDIVAGGYDRIAYAMGSGVLAAKSVRSVLGHCV